MPSQTVTRPRVVAAMVAALLLSSIPVLSVDSLAADGTYDVPGWIDSKGNKNVSKPLQRFIDSVPDGSTIRFPNKGVYKLAGNGLRLDGRSDLTLVGNGSTLRSKGCGAEDSVISIGKGGASSGITIRGFMLAGSNQRAGTPSAYRHQCGHAHGVSVHRSRQIVISGVEIKRVHGDCLYVGGGGYARSVNVVMRDSVCRLTGRQGVAITAGNRVRVEDSGFWNIGIIAFDIEPNRKSDGAVDVVFTRNRVGKTGRSKQYRNMFFGANGNLNAVVRNIEISHNVAYKQPLNTLVGDEDKGWSGGRNHYDIRFVGNVSRVRARGPVLTFKHVNGLVVRNVKQPLSSGRLARITDSVNVDYDP